MQGCGYDEQPLGATTANAPVRYIARASEENLDVAEFPVASGVVLTDRVPARPRAAMTTVASDP
jgi:hypothetical protein